MNPNTRKRPAYTRTDDLDREYRTMRRVMLGWVLFVMALYGTLAAGAIFVGYKILAHFGVL